MSARSLKKKTSESSLKASDRESIEEKPQTNQKAVEENQQAILMKEMQQKKRQYWVAVSRRLKKGRQFAQRAVNEKQSDMKEEILQGKYEIKQRQWPVAQQNTKNSRTKISSSAVHLKKDLQSQLQGIESRINQQLREKANKLMSQEQHQNFMKKIEQQWKDQQVRRLEAAKQQQQNRIQQQNKMKQQQQRQQLQRKNRKKQQLIDKLKYIEEQRRKQAEMYEQQQKLLKQKYAERTMAQKMGEQYNYKQNEFLQQKKKRLAQIRALHKPIDKSQLDSFSQKIDQLHEDKKKERESKELKNASINKFYRSAFYKRVQEGQKSRIFSDSKHEQDLLKRKQARDKLKRYSQQVWQDYKPAIDDKKAQQIKFRSQSVKPKSYSSTNEIGQNPRKLGLRYLQYNKINHKLLGADGDVEEEEEDDKKNKKIDYLAELREKNRKKHPMTAQNLIQRLDKKHLPKEEKAKQILDFTQRIEMKAKRREQVQKIGGGVSEQLDALYLQAIQAKLSLLDLDHE